MGQRAIANGASGACGKLQPSFDRTEQASEFEARNGSSVPPLVSEVLRSPGQPLDATTRTFMEPRFGHDFSGVRVHTDEKAAESAWSVNAQAYTVGRHVVFGAGSFAPGTHDGRRLVAHELAHTLQQANGPSAGADRISDARAPAEQEADRTANNVMAGRLTDVTTIASAQVLHRQPKSPAKQEPKEEEGEVVPAKDTFAGTTITEIIISLARKRVGFRWAMGMILGTVDTDLKPGKYELKPDAANQKWTINNPDVKSGLRFDVRLEGALPWTLSYPETVPLTVVAGASEPKPTDTFDPQRDLADPLWLYESWPDDPKLKPVSGIEDFESTTYDFSYRSDKGNLSKWVRVSYRDNTVKDINIDSITEATPKLWKVRQEVLDAMGNYNTLWILQFGFPAVFMIITINPVGMPAAGKGLKYTATRRTFSKTGTGGKSGPGEPPVKTGEPAPKAVEPAPKTAPKVDEVVPVEPAPKVGEPTAPKADSKSVIDASSKVVPRADGTFRLNRKNFSHPEKVIGEPESVVREDANREAVAAELAASKPNVEKVYVGKDADRFINGSLGEEPSADTVAVTKEGKFYVYEAGGSDVSPTKLGQLEHTSQQLGSGSVLRQTLVMKGKLTTPGYTVENGVLMSGGKRVIVDGKPVYIKFTTQ